MSDLEHVQETENAPEVPAEQDLDLLQSQDTEEAEGSPEGDRNDTFVPEEELTPEVKKRISKLTWERHELERQYEARLREMEEKLKAQPVAKPASDLKRPTMAECDYDEDKYQAALDEYMEKKLEAKLENRLKDLASAPQKQKEQELVGQWKERAGKYAAENPEYIQLMKERSNAITSNALASYAASSEIGPKLHHYLLDNFQDLQRIQSLPEWQQGAELAKLETKLRQVKQKQPSKAPPPPAQIKAQAKPAGTKRKSRFPM